MPGDAVADFAAQRDARVRLPGGALEVAQVLVRAGQRGQRVALQ